MYIYIYIYKHLSLSLSLVSLVSLVFVFSLRAALESLYHESIGTSEMDYWTA